MHQTPIQQHIHHVTTFLLCDNWNQSMFTCAARQWQRPYWYVRVVADIAQARLLRNQKAVKKMYERRP